jgi:glycosyltransferase involved in cell wall biosynthesis
MQTRTADAPETVRGPRLVVAIPCLNEERTIGQVVADFRRALPDARIVVFDNASTDATAAEATRAGASVHRVTQRGKGNVVREVFRRIDADAIVLVDGDATYPAEHVHALLAPVLGGEADMVVGTRLAQYEGESFRPLHVFGNNLVRNTLNVMFGSDLSDVLSGFRAFGRRFARTMPVLSSGFEVETELTVSALDKGFRVAEVPIPYGTRPEGSESKLNTFRDGARVLITLVRIYKDYRPLRFFGLLGLVSLLLGAGVGILVIDEFVHLGEVRGLARASLAVGLGVFGGISIGTGLVLDTVNRRARELYALLADRVSRQGPSTS